MKMIKKFFYEYIIQNLNFDEFKIKLNKIQTNHIYF